jgi:hypothetical protein
LVTAPFESVVSREGGGGGGIVVVGRGSCSDRGEGNEGAGGAGVVGGVASSAFISCDRVVGDDVEVEADDKEEDDDDADADEEDDDTGDGEETVVEEVEELLRDEEGER